MHHRSQGLLVQLLAVSQELVAAVSQDQVIVVGQDLVVRASQDLVIVVGQDRAVAIVQDPVVAVMVVGKDLVVQLVVATLPAAEVIKAVNPDHKSTVSISRGTMSLADNPF
jgi:hypothetical protein